MIIFLTILGIALLILAHEFGHFICAKAFGVRVDEFGIGFPPRLFGKTRGETMYSVNLLPLGGFVRLHGETAGMADMNDERSFIAQPAWKRLVVIAAGVAMNVVLGWLIVSTVLFIGTPRGLLIDRVLPGSAATEAGLLAGDFITGFIEGSAFTGYVRAHVGEAITVNIVRGGKHIAVSATPRAANAGGGVLGVVIAEAGAAPLPFFAALREGFVQSAIMMASVVVGLWSILVSLFTQGKLLEGFVGPVGIFSVAQQTGLLGLAFLLQLIGAISLNLAVLNIMPFPALDGGRLLFLVFEKIKGSRLSPRFEMIANATGFIILLALILTVTARDVVRLF